ncbi:hypothetical protein GCM10011390_47090 [Aureimonas endophytica]|uniref:Cyclophilin-like domain-containing protein n=1 Tax=Aureimonas endophytica TaxID=2027858 RepID=A0A917A1F0_9HYPH|nr:cyclophilin-like fold protein [Aureimonas endophytica]GGE22315.1 hypothetical protein GCM10011390_47090 [Aureimonas endophytica]
MRPARTTIRRRALLGALLAVPVLARPAFAQSRHDPASQEPTDMRIRFTFADRSLDAVLTDNPTARDLVTLLPLELTIEDYSTNEKIVRLPRNLSEEASGPFGNEAAGDLCYYAPWGNLALFHAGYRYSRSLIRLGRFEAGYDALLTRGEFPVSVERAG